MPVTVGLERKRTMTIKGMVLKRGTHTIYKINFPPTSETKEYRSGRAVVKTEDLKIGIGFSVVPVNLASI